MGNGFIAALIILVAIGGYLELKESSYKHEKEMIMLQRDIQRDTMPKDSIIVIQGNKYKLEKYE
jgi:hypothetical protein